jgi:peroxiredoxin
MTIEIGAKLPEATFKAVTGEGPAAMTTSEIFAGKRVALFAVPGAFTPTCHVSHLPSFLNQHDALKAKGVDLIACTAVNDVFAMGAWAKASGAEGKILFLADGNGDFARAVGMDIDLSVAGLGVRSKRYAMLVEDGVVKALMIEDSPGVADKSTAEKLLQAL